MIGGNGPGLSVDRLQDGIEQRPRSEADRVVGREARLLGGLGDRGACPVVVEVGGVEREAGDARRPQRERDSLVQADQLPQARNRVPGIALDLGGVGLVAEDEGVRGRAVDQAERDARVRRMGERPLALDEEQLPAAAVALDDEPLRRAG